VEEKGTRTKRHGNQNSQNKNFQIRASLTKERRTPAFETRISSVEIEGERMDVSTNKGANETQLGRFKGKY